MIMDLFRRAMFDDGNAAKKQPNRGRRPKPKRNAARKVRAAKAALAAEAAARDRRNNRDIDAEWEKQQNSKVTAGDGRTASVPDSVPVCVHGGIIGITGMGCGPSKPAEGEGGGKAFGARGEKAVQNPAYEGGGKGEQKEQKKKKAKKEKKKFTREDAVTIATAITGVPAQLVEAVAAAMYALSDKSFSGQSDSKSGNSSLPVETGRDSARGH